MPGTTTVFAEKAGVMGLLMSILGVDQLVHGISLRRSC
jgi:hypothetical protein